MYTLIEEFEDDARVVTNAAFDTTAAEADAAAPDDDTLPADTEDVEAKAAGEEGLDMESWSDDPVRMYLTQMGEIPLLTRKQEIELASELKTLASDFVPNCWNAITLSNRRLKS
ncbi:sigma-70 factor domain-containing protein [Planctomycetota bacterium]